MATNQLSAENWHRGVPQSARSQVRFGCWTLLICIGGFSVWGSLAPLDGAVVASGSFVANGQNKQIQHLEGGILREVLVREGDLVESGARLLLLDDTAAKAKLRRLALKRLRLSMMQARLESEIKGKDTFGVPKSLAEKADDAEVRALFDRQLAELASRRSKLNAEQEVLKHEAAGLRESIRGFESQVASIRDRLAIFSDELKDKKSLYQKELARKPEISALQRAEAAVAGELGELLARIADAKQRVARAEQQIVQVRWSANQKAIEELRTTETELDDIEAQIDAAQDVVDRTEIRAPVRGIVVRLNHNTPGGVIAAGALILELLPVNDEQIIEARVRASDVANVVVGQEGLVRLSALNQRLTPMVKGIVRYVSADAIADQQNRSVDDKGTGKRDFVVRIALDPADQLMKLGKFRPTPGMPADVFIKTGERTFFSYMFRPVLDSFSHAFREH